MKALGLEIRKRDTVQGVFEDVQRVLERYGIPEEGISRAVQVKTTAHALNRMLQPGRWMDVTTIDRAAEVCGFAIPAERRRVYGAIHCVHWNEMESEYRTMIIAMVLDDFKLILQDPEL